MNIDSLSFSGHSNLIFSQIVCILVCENAFCVALATELMIKLYNLIYPIYFAIYIKAALFFYFYLFYLFDYIVQ